MICREVFREASAQQAVDNALAAREEVFDLTLRERREVDDLLDNALGALARESWQDAGECARMAYHTLRSTRRA